MKDSKGNGSGQSLETCGFRKVFPRYSTTTQISESINTGIFA